MKWVGHVAHMGEKRGAYRIFFGRLVGERRLEIPWLRWESNEMDLQDWIDLIQDKDKWRAVVKAVTNLQVP
jgi:hypothetical protein